MAERENRSRQQRRPRQDGLAIEQTGDDIELTLEATNQRQCCLATANELPLMSAELVGIMLHDVEPIPKQFGRTQIIYRLRRPAGRVAAPKLAIQKRTNSEWRIR